MLYNLLIKHLHQAKLSHRGFFICFLTPITMTASKASIIQYQSLLDFNFAGPLTLSPLKHVLKQEELLILGHISFGVQNMLI